MQGSPTLELTLPIWRNLFGRETTSQIDQYDFGTAAKKFGDSFKMKSILQQAESTYWNLALTRESVKVSKDALERAIQLNKLNVYKADSGLADKSDVFQTQAAVEARKLDLKAAQDDEQSAARDFNSLRGRDSSSVAEGLTPMTTEHLTGLAIPARSELRDDTRSALEQNHSAVAGAQASLEKYKPTLEVFGSYALNNPNPADTGNAIDKSFDDSRPTQMIGIRFSAPLELGLVNDVRQGWSAQVHASETAYHRRLFEQEETWNSLKDKFQQAKDRLGIYDQLEKTQKVKLEYERVRRQRGRTTTQQVLQFEQDYEQAQLGRLQDNVGNSSASSADENLWECTMNPNNGSSPGGGSLADLSIKRPVFITCVVILSLAAGLISMSRLGIDLFPDVTFPIVVVTTPYPGAGPQEVETLVSKPIEDELSTVSGVKRLSSENVEGTSRVIVEFTMETDVKYAEQQVRDRVGSVRFKLPTDIKEPTIRRIDPSDQPVLTVALNADLPPSKLFDLADDRIRPRLEQVNQVGLVEIKGGRKREVHVNLDRKKLKTYELSVTGVGQKLAGAGEDIPSGKKSEGDKETIFRTIGQFKDITDIRTMVVNFFGNDVPVRIGDVGTVEDSLEDETNRAYLNGKKALFINAYKQSGANTIRVVDDLKKRVEQINKEYADQPGHPQLTVVRDGSVWININVMDVQESISIGILLCRCSWFSSSWGTAARRSLPVSLCPTR